MTEAHIIFRHILVPTDGSSASVAAGRLAVELAVAQRARLTFVYVVDTSMVKELAAASGKMTQQIQDQLKLTGKHYLNYLATLAQRHGITAEKVVREGTPHIEIVDVARERKVDLIVMGHVGQRGPRRILIGSVTERVIEYAECPVLVTKKR